MSLDNRLNESCVFIIVWVQANFHNLLHMVFRAIVNYLIMHKMYYKTRKPLFVLLFIALTFNANINLVFFSRAK